MLVLSRSLHASILIGDDVSVTVVDIKPDILKVRLGIIAPKNLPILRPELHDDSFLANTCLARLPEPVRRDPAQAVLGAVAKSLRQPIADALARGAAPETLAAMIESAARQAIEDVAGRVHIVPADQRSDG